MKRASERQITKDDPTSDGEEEAASEMREGFEKASAEVMAGRRIVKARRSVARNDGVATKPNPFAASFQSNAAPAPVPSGGSAVVADAKKDPADAQGPIAPAAPVVPSNRGAEEAGTKPGVAVADNGHAAAEKADSPSGGEAIVAVGKSAVADSSTAPVPAPVSTAPESEVAPSAAVEPGNSPRPEVEQEGAASGAAAASQPATNATDPESTAGHSASEDAAGKAAETEAPEKPVVPSAVPVVSNVEKSGKEASDSGSATNGRQTDVPSKEPSAAVVDGEGGAGNRDESAPVEKVEVSKNAKGLDDAGDAVDAHAKSGAGEGQTGAAVGAETAKVSADDTKPNDANEEPVKNETKPVFSFGGISGTSGTTFGDAAAAATGFSFAAQAASGLAVNGGSKGQADAEKANDEATKFVETDVVTGEEEDKEVFRKRCKLFVLENKKWTERGVGSVKLNTHVVSGKSRILMRTEATLRVILNTPVGPYFNVDPASEKSVRFQGLNVDDEQKHCTFLARFGSKNDRDEFVSAVSRIVEKQKDK